MRTGVGGSFLAALVLVALLVGCGGGGSKASTSPTHRQSSASSSTNSAAATTTTAPRSSAVAYWPYEKVIGKLSGRTLVLPHGSLRLNSALLECNGDGAPRKAGTTRRWSRYTCTQTVFQGGADHDVTFDVMISSATQLTISSPRYGPE